MPAPYYLTFVGPIQYPASKNLRNAVCSAIMAQNPASSITLFMSSSGGSTQEGLALFNFLRALPVDVTTHNIGAIESVANFVFLAGKQRFSCETSRFIFHELTWTFVAETMERDRILDKKLFLDADERHFTEITKRQTKLTDSDLKTFKLFGETNIVIPGDALKVGIIEDIKDAKVPAGAVMWNVEY